MHTSLFDLTNQVAIVTGASRGIGEAIAKLLANQGAHVIVSSRKIEGCEKVVAKIQQQGGSAEAVACHIGDMDQIQNLFKHVKEKHGKLNILVNNAAANPYFGHITETDLGAFQKTLDINIRGYFYMTSEGAKLMKENKEGNTDGSKGGAIVNVASVNGVIPGPMQGIYSISKAAVISMTKAFARECAGWGVRVNALLPGFTDTKFASALTSNEAIVKQVLAHVPLNRIAMPEEMAGAVLYLASEASSYTTGIELNVDGGYLIS